MEIIKEYLNIEYTGKYPSCRIWCKVVEIDAKIKADALFEVMKRQIQRVFHL